jgi:Flp pilus assembly secretin CpaC
MARHMLPRYVSPSACVKAVATAASAGTFLILSILPSSATDLVVRYDQAQLIRLPRPAADVIVGNPSIADVAIQGTNLLVVTGKTFGVTNVIALDADRNVIQDQRILVERDNQKVVTLLKGSTRESYTCTPTCAPTMTIGDTVPFFESVNKQSQKKHRFSTGDVSATPQSGAEE